MTPVSVSETVLGKPCITPTIKQIQIPLTGTTWAVIQVPVPMSEENWQELQDFLKLMKKPITGSASTTPGSKTMPEVSIEALKQGIRDLHGCDSTSVESVP